jgi:hypothetical protein
VSANRNNRNRKDQGHSTTVHRIAGGNRPVFADEFMRVSRDARRFILPDSKVLDIARDYFTSGLSQKELTAKHGLTISQLQALVRAQDSNRMAWAMAVAQLASEGIRCSRRKERKAVPKTEGSKRGRLTDDEVLDLRLRYRSGTDLADLAREKGYTEASMRAVLNGTNYAHVREKR